MITINKSIGFESIYSFDVLDNCIWFAIPTAHYIGQFSLKENKEIFYIGTKYEQFKPLCFPENVAIYDGNLYMSELGSKRVLKLNILDKSLYEMYKFEERV